MDGKELLKKQNELHDLIKRIAYEKGLSKDDLMPMFDGVYDGPEKSPFLDLNHYTCSHPRIMVILKEARDDKEDGTPKGGGCKTYGIFNCDDFWKYPTYQPLIYAIYGYRHGKQWNQMKWLSEDHSMQEELKGIAYINVNKMPGASVSDDRQMRIHYSQWKDVLKKQIDVYDPDVIIFGGTFDYFGDDVFSNLIKVDEDSVYKAKEMKAVVYMCGDKVLIDTYHPSYTYAYGSGESEKISNFVNPILKVLNKYYPRS